MIPNIRPHESADHNALLDILFAAQTTDTELDAKCISEAGQVLTQSDSYKHLGITLLHKHFDIQEDELMFQEFSADGKEIHASPRKRTEILEAPVVPVNLCFDMRFPNETSLVGLDYMRAPLGASDEEIDFRTLEELKRVFTHYDRLQKYGIRVLAGLNRSNESTYMEFSDSSERSSVCHLVQRTDPRLSGTIETVLQWKRTSIGFSKMDCVMCCYTSSDGHVPWCGNPDNDEDE